MTRSNQNPDRKCGRDRRRITRRDLKLPADVVFAVQWSMVLVAAFSQPDDARIVSSQHSLCCGLTSKRHEKRSPVPVRHSSADHSVCDNGSSNLPPSPESCRQCIPSHSRPSSLHEYHREHFPYDRARRKMLRSLLGPCRTLSRTWVSTWTSVRRE